MSIFPCKTSPSNVTMRVCGFASSMSKCTCSSLDNKSECSEASSVDIGPKRLDGTGADCCAFAQTAREQINYLTAPADCPLESGAEVGRFLVLDRRGW